MEISLNQVDVAKLNLGPDDALMVTVKADLEDWSILKHLSDNFQEHFPDNKVIVLGARPKDNIEYSIVSNPKPVSLGYCTDCSCGKKEQIESSSRP